MVRVIKILNSDWQSIAWQAEKGILSLANSSIIQALDGRSLKRHPVHQTEQYTGWINISSPFVYELPNFQFHWLLDGNQILRKFTVVEFCTLGQKDPKTSKIILQSFVYKVS